MLCLEEATSFLRMCEQTQEKRYNKNYGRSLDYKSLKNDSAFLLMPAITDIAPDSLPFCKLQVVLMQNYGFTFKIALAT